MPDNKISSTGVLNSDTLKTMDWQKTSCKCYTKLNILYMLIDKTPPRLAVQNFLLLSQPKYTSGIRPAETLLSELSQSKYPIS